MTPDELRALAGEAKREEAAMVPVHPSDLGYLQSSEALTWLEDHAVQLALLCAEMGEQLQRITTTPNEAIWQRQEDVDACRRVLGSLEVLEKP